MYHIQRKTIRPPLPTSTYRTDMSKSPSGNQAWASPLTVIGVRLQVGATANAEPGEVHK